MKQRLYFVLCCFLVSSLICAQEQNDGKRSPFAGEGLEGGGACAGVLKIYPDKLTWIAGNSECEDVPYETIVFNKHGDDIHAVYRLKSTSKKCIPRIVVLDHTTQYIESRGGEGWNIVGYRSWKAYRRKSYNNISCPLY